MTQKQPLASYSNHPRIMARNAYIDLDHDFYTSNYTIYRNDINNANKDSSKKKNTTQKSAHIFRECNHFLVHHVH